MAARSSKGMASQAGLALRAASTAVLTCSGVADAYSATTSLWREGFCWTWDLMVCVWIVSCVGLFRSEVTHCGAIDGEWDIEGHLALQFL